MTCWGRRLTMILIAWQWNTSTDIHVCFFNDSSILCPLEHADLLLDLRQRQCYQMYLFNLWYAMQVLSCLDTFQHLDAHSSDWHDLTSYIQTPLIWPNYLHCISVLIHSCWLSHTPYITSLHYRHIIFTIFQWSININSFHTLVRLMLSPLPFHISSFIFPFI